MIKATKYWLTLCDCRKDLYVFGFLRPSANVFLCNDRIWLTSLSQIQIVFRENDVSIIYMGFLGKKLRLTCETNRIERVSKNDYVSVNYRDNLRRYLVWPVRWQEASERVYDLLLYRGLLCLSFNFRIFSKRNKTALPADAKSVNSWIYSLADTLLHVLTRITRVRQTKTWN